MDEETRKRLASAIVEARGDRSMRKFAKDMGVSLQTIQNWEQGVVVPDLENLEKIAIARRQSLEEFLSEIRQVEREFEETEPKVAEDLYFKVRRLPKLEMARLIKMLVDDITDTET